MLKKTIKYKDYNGNERTEDFYFNLTQSEIVEMEYSVTGRFSNFLTRIMNTNDEPELMKMFRELILMAYGVKSDDGKRFIKNDEVRDTFYQSEAYNVMFMEFCQSTQAVIDFVNGILPAEMRDKIDMKEVNKLLDHQD